MLVFPQNCIRPSFPQKTPHHTFFSMEQWVQKLGLQPHPAGGFFKETFKSTIETTSATGLTVPSFTNILFLQEEGGLPNFHLIQSDEVFVFHDGSPLTVHCIRPDGTYEQFRLGKCPEQGEYLQLLVPKGLVFASSVEKGWSLVGCMVSPGFVFSEFRQFSIEELVTRYPQHESILSTLSS